MYAYENLSKHATDGGSSLSPMHWQLATGAFPEIRFSPKSEAIGYMLSLSKFQFLFPNSPDRSRIIILHINGELQLAFTPTTALKHNKD